MYTSHRNAHIDVLSKKNNMHFIFIHFKVQNKLFNDNYFYETMGNNKTSKKWTLQFSFIIYCLHLSFLLIKTWVNLISLEIIFELIVEKTHNIRYSTNSHVTNVSFFTFFCKKSHENFILIVRWHVNFYVHSVIFYYRITIIDVMYVSNINCYCEVWNRMIMLVLAIKLFTINGVLFSWGSGKRLFMSRDFPDTFFYPSQR